MTQGFNIQFAFLSSVEGGRLGKRGEGGRGRGGKEGGGETYHNIIFNMQQRHTLLARQMAEDIAAENLINVMEKQQRERRLIEVCVHDILCHLHNCMIFYLL